MQFIIKVRLIWQDLLLKQAERSFWIYEAFSHLLYLSKSNNDNFNYLFFFLLTLLWKNGNSWWRTFYQVLGHETLYFLKEDILNLKWDPVSAEAKARNFYQGHKETRSVLQHYKTPKTLLPALFLTLITFRAYQLKQYISVYYVWDQEQTVCSVPLLHPLLQSLLLSTPHNGEREMQRGRAEIMGDSFFPAILLWCTAKSIFKPSQWKQLWKGRTICTLPPTSGSESSCGHDCCSFTFPSEAQGELWCDTKVSHHSKYVSGSAPHCVYMCIGLIHLFSWQVSVLKHYFPSIF